MVATKDLKRDSAAERGKNARHLEKFLPGERGDAVLDVAQEDERICSGSVDRPQEPFEPFGTVAFEVQPVRGKVCLNPEMQVGDDQNPLAAFNDERRTVP